MIERELDVDTQVVEPLRRANQTLDDIREAKLMAGIEARLDALGGSRTRARSAGVRWTAAGLTLAAAAAAAVLVFHREPPPPAPQPSGRRAVALSPYVYVGPGARTEWLDPVRTVTVPAGGQMRARVGKAVRLTLVGPGSASASTIDGVTELALEGGLLLVDFDHAAGGELRVLSRDAVVTVVGTLFVVDARKERSRVGVARGIVSVRGVQPAAGVARIAAGSVWTAGETNAGPLPEDLSAALSEHDASAPPPSLEPTFDDPPLVLPAPRGIPARPTRPSLPGSTAKPARFPPTAAPSAATSAATSAPPTPPAVEPPPPAERDRSAEAEALYAAAESLMRRHANDAARRILLDLIARHGDDPRAEVALLDLARLALSAGDVAEARRFLSRLPDPTHDPALSETARNLRALTERRATP